MYEELIEYYKTVRKSKGINQKDAAKLSGVNHNAVGIMERLEQSPSLEAFCKMAKGIGMMVVLAPLPKGMEPTIVKEEIEVESPDIDWDEFNTDEE